MANDGRIDLAQYTIEQLRELQNTMQAELERRQPIEPTTPATSQSVSGRFTRRNDLVGWLTARFRRLLVYGSGSLDVGEEGVTVNGWQRTWLGVAEQVSLSIPNDELRNAAASNGAEVRFEWDRPYRLARIVNFRADSPEAAKDLLRALPARQSPGFAKRWTEL